MRGMLLAWTFERIFLSWSFVNGLDTCGLHLRLMRAQRKSQAPSYRQYLAGESTLVLHQPILVQVPQPSFERNPTSDSMIETMDVVSVKSLAMMSASSPPNPERRSQ